MRPTWRGMFRTVRFGTAEAHGRAEMMEFNYLSEQGANPAKPQRPLPGRLRENARRDCRAGKRTTRN